MRRTCMHSFSPVRSLVLSIFSRRQSLEYPVSLLLTKSNYTLSITYTIPLLPSKLPTSKA